MTSVLQWRTAAADWWTFYSFGIRKCSKYMTYSQYLVPDRHIILFLSTQFPTDVTYLCDAMSTAFVVFLPVHTG